MKKFILGFISATCALLVVSLIAYAVTTHNTSLLYNFSNGVTVSSGAVDMSSASSVAVPVGQIDVAELDLSDFIGAAPGATCTAGQWFIDTDETDDTNCTTAADNSICVCSATNTWVEAGN